MTARMVVCASHTPGMLRDKGHEFGHSFRAGVAEAAARVAAFGPDLVVFFGSDHRRAFVDPVPAIAVMTGAQGLGDLGSATGPTTSWPRPLRSWRAACWSGTSTSRLAVTSPWTTGSGRPSSS